MKKSNLVRKERCRTNESNLRKKFKEKEKELICVTEIPILTTVVPVSAAQKGAKRSFLRQALNDAETPD